MSTASWLRELGAVRPMAPAANHVLVLGKWSEGHYPIEWRRGRQPQRRITDDGRIEYLPPLEHWYVHGIPAARPLTREDCERILRVMNGE